MTELRVRPAGTLPAAHREGRLAAIDGLRAVAVAGVIGYHFGWGPRSGLLGVDLFFVISGFVITLVLLRERGSRGRTDFSGFWKRRVRRIFPPLAVMLLVVAAWSWFGARLVSPSFRIAVGDSSLFSLISAMNWWEIYGGGGYWGLAAESNPLTHLWSLAIEEQFYLLYPFLFVLIVSRLRREHRAPTMLALAIVAYAWSAAFALLGDPSVDRIYLGTDTRSGALLLGAAVAFWSGDRLLATGEWGAPSDDLAYRSATSQRAVPVIAGVAFVAMLALWMFSEPTLPQLSTFVLPLSGLLSAVLIWTLALGRPVGLGRLLALRPVVYVGRLSYSLYLWHWVVWVFLAQTILVGRAVTPWIALAASLVLSAATYHFVEKPILSRTWTWRGLLVLCGTVFAAIALSSWATLATVEVPTSQDSPSLEVSTG